MEKRNLVVSEDIRLNIYVTSWGPHLYINLENYEHCYPIVAGLIIFSHQSLSNIYLKVFYHSNVDYIPGN